MGEGMEAPLVSVIVPVFNVKKYVAHCLRSLAGQTLTNIEIICVDDHGSDGSMDIVRRFCAEDPRFRALRHAENKGPGAARNTGIREARGKYVAFVDSDDWLVPDALRKEVAVIEEFALDSVWMLYRQVYDDEGTGETQREALPQGIVDISVETLVKGNPSACCKLFVTESIRRHGILFDEDVIYGEDLSFYFRYYCYSKRAFQLNEALYQYRKRSDSTIGVTEHGRGRPKDLVDACLRNYRYMLERNLFDAMRDCFVALYSEHFGVFLYSRHYKDEMIARLKEMLVEIEYPQKYDVDKAPVFEAVRRCACRPSWRKWYKIVNALNKINPFPTLRKRWRVWIRVNLLAR